MPTGRGRVTLTGADKKAVAAGEHNKGFHKGRQPTPEADDMEQTTLRIPEAILERADALISHLESDPAIAALGRDVTRSDVLRTAILRGLAVIEAEAGKDKKTEGKKAKRRKK